MFIVEPTVLENPKSEKNLVLFFTCVNINRDMAQTATTQIRQVLDGSTTSSSTERRNPKSTPSWERLLTLNAKTRQKRSDLRRCYSKVSSGKRIIGSLCAWCWAVAVSAAAASQQWWNDCQLLLITIHFLINYICVSYWCVIKTISDYTVVCSDLYLALFRSFSMPSKGPKGSLVQDVRSWRR